MNCTARWSFSSVRGRECTLPATPRCCPAGQGNHVTKNHVAKSTGPSLNNCLHTGPKFDQRILDILLRFKVFLNVSTSEKDRNVLRFLWYDEITKKQPEVRVFRFTCVVFGISSNPFLLNATISHTWESSQHHNHNWWETSRRQCMSMISSPGRKTKIVPISCIQNQRSYTERWRFQFTEARDQLRTTTEGDRWAGN